MAARDSNLHSSIMASTRRHRPVLIIALLLWRVHGFSTPRQVRSVGRRRAFFEIENASPQTRQYERRRHVLFATTVPNQIRNNDMQSLERQVVRLGKQGKTDKAMRLYNDSKQKSVRLMNGAIDACARARPTRLNQAFDILHEGCTLHGLRPNVFTFGVLMSACARARRADKALDLLQSMEKDYNVVPNAVVYSTAISACARADPPRSQQALNLLKAAPEEMSVVGYNAALSACAMAGQWESALDLLREMNDSTLVDPDEVSYGTVLAACERSNQWETLLELAAEMQNREVTMDSMAVTSVLHACQQLGLATEALEYLEKAKSASTAERKTAGWQRKGVKQPLQGADAVAYRLAISACARGGHWQSGIRLLQESKKVHGPPDVVAYTSAITGCEYAGEWQRAFGLVDAMRKDGVQPNVVTFAAVIGACATAIANAKRLGQAEQMASPKQKALLLLKVMKKDRTVVKPNVVVYNAAIRVCAEALDMDRAFELLQELEEEGLQPTIVTFGSLMTACERLGDVDGVSRVFLKAKEYSLEANEIIYGAAISCCRKAGQADRVLLLLRKMIKEGLHPNVATFNTVLLSQTEGKGTDIEMAYSVYKLMLSKYATNAKPNRQTYNILIRALLSRKRPREAEAFLKKMKNEGYVPDVDLFTATVSVYERTRQPLKALRLMQSMKQDGYDFYEFKVLDAAFKKALEMANAVGRLNRDELDPQLVIGEMDDDDDDEALSRQLEIQDGEDDAFIVNGTGANLIHH